MSIRRTQWEILVWGAVTEGSNFDYCHLLLLCLACATALGNSQQLLLSLLLLLFLLLQMHQTQLEGTFNRPCISLIHDLWFQTFMTSKSLPWAVILSPTCLNRILGLAHCSWRKEMMAKSQGLSWKSCSGKLYGKKEGNGSNDGSEIVSITEAGKHEHKGKRPAKEFLERRDSRTVWRERWLTVRDPLWPA